MRSSPKRRAIQILVYLIIAVVLGLGGIYWAGTAVMYQKQKRFRTAIETAPRLALESFMWTKTVDRVEIPANKRGEVTEALPFYVIFPLNLRQCFVPRHRIVAEFNERTNVMLICFECDQAKIDGKALFAMPSVWASELRQLFLANGIGLTVEE